MPQWLTSVAVFTSQPSAAEPLQSAKPASHVPIWQAPATHAPVAWFGEHARPQPPQWATLVCGSTSQPLSAAPSQSSDAPVQT
ncbi:MAG: hypothetical protein U0326_36495 [Polyangiales bacterium]